jgi:Heparinase II/III-like protein/Heparinase II/III N-terminus
LTVRTAAAALTSMVARIRGRSLDELRVRSVQALYTRLERLADRFSAPRPTSIGRPPGEVLDCDLGTLVGAGANPAAIARAIAQRDPDTHIHLAQQSDAAELGRVALLGYEAMSFGNPPRWHREPLSGMDAPRLHWSRIDHLDTTVVGDHKLLWELNRHQYLLAPAVCWLLDREARRFDLIQSHLESWLADNPPRQGVNWVSSLEVAYRAIAWCWLLSMLREAPWRPDLRLRLISALEAHARHIERHLSTYFSPNTHLTGEALGLFYIGTMLRRAHHGRRWRARGAAILESAIQRQVYPDGSYFEQASHYQRYTAEIYLHYLLLAQATGWTVSASACAALGDLFAVLRSLASGAGVIPLFGDDDGGLVLPLDHRPPEDVRGLLLAAGVALRRPDLIPTAEAPPGVAYWLCGTERTDRARAEPAVAPNWRNVYFACGGVAVLRDGWNPDAATAVIDCGPHGALSCGHSHADALAMTLALGRIPLVIDRGTLTYTGAERNAFRATLSHNTLEIEGMSSVTPGAAFKWLPGIPARAEGVVVCGTDFSSFFGLAPGHVAGGRPSAHCRRVLHQRGGAWLIHDRGARAGAPGGVLRWQLAPQLSAIPHDPDSVSIQDGAGVRVAMMLVRGAAPVRVVTRDVSPRFGQRIAAQCLQLPVDDSLEALTIIAPAAPGGSVPTFEVDGPLHGGSIAWSDALGRHRVILGPPQEAAQLPQLMGCNADLLWWVEGAAHGSHEVLLAAMPAFVPAVPNDAQVITDLLKNSGKMMLWTCTGRRWTQLGVEEPRRG